MDPRTVAALGGAFTTAQQHAAVAATAKHFPGLGAAESAQNTDERPVTGNAVIYQPNGHPVWATNTWLPSGPTAVGDSMQPGQVLNPGNSLTSADGRFRFVYQGDGNLVLYQGNQAPWASGTNGRGVGVCVMQGDGNLVIYLRGGHPIWASNTNGDPGSHLVVQNDRNVVIYKPNGSPVWATGTNILSWTGPEPVGAPNGRALSLSKQIVRFDRLSACVRPDRRCAAEARSEACRAEQSTLANQTLKPSARSCSRPSSVILSGPHGGIQTQLICRSSTMPSRSPPAPGPRSRR